MTRSTSNHNQGSSGKSDNLAAGTDENWVGERIAKVIARAGVCSRRQAEALIAEGKVKVDGRVLDTPAFLVTGDENILVEGAPLPARERTRLWLFHKPRGSVTTNRDPQGRRTIFDLLPAELPRTMTIGRLDINTEGLLLLTNDGGLARILELPSTGWLRRYRVRAHGRVEAAAIEKLRSGITIDGMVYGPIEGTIDRVQGTNTWLTLGLREGKNREVKKVLESLDLTVNRLIRVSFGPFQLGELEPRAIRELPARALREQLGTRLAADAGVDLAPPPRSGKPARAGAGATKNRRTSSSVKSPPGKPPGRKSPSRKSPAGNKSAGGRKTKGRRNADRRRPI